MLDIDIPIYFKYDQLSQSKYENMSPTYLAGLSNLSLFNLYLVITLTTYLLTLNFINVQELPPKKFIIIMTICSSLVTDPIWATTIISESWFSHCNTTFFHGDLLDTSQHHNSFTMIFTHSRESKILFYYFNFSILSFLCSFIVVCLRMLIPKHCDIF